jgi:hypothetical protein
MSTKTTFKRIALVTVAALGFGVMSTVAPASAAIANDTLTVTDGTGVIGDTVTATSATATISFISSDSTAGAGAGVDTHSVTAQLVSSPAGNTLFPRLSLAETTSAAVDSAATVANADAIGTAYDAYDKIKIKPLASNAATSAKFNVYIGAAGAATTGVVKAGTYVVRIVPASSPNAGVATYKDITIVIAAAATAVGALTHMAPAAAVAPVAALGAVDTAVAVSKTASSTVAGVIAVTFVSASGSTVAESYTATITGAGTLGQGNTATASAGTVVGRSITMNHANYIHIFADGTGGVGTITIANAAGTVFATKTVSFFGAPAVIVLSSNSNASVGVLSAPVKATVYDAAGYVVSGVKVYATSADTAVISNSYTASANTSSKGEADVSLTGVKLGTAKITVGIATSATDVTTTGYAVKSDALTVTVAGGVSEQAGVVVTTDKQSYTPGSYAYVTVKAVDKDGKTLAPRPSSGKYTVFAAGGISGSLPFETVTGIISSVDFTPAAKAGTADTVNSIVAQAGEYVYKIKLPSYQGDFTFSWTTAAAGNFPGNIAAGAVAGSTTVTLSDPGSQAAVDAATEATDAANAATDAALAAADAADAATSAAEDASAAVATLAKSVNTALGSLKKQITALTKLVNKLLKK